MIGTGPQSAGVCARPVRLRPLVIIISPLTFRSPAPLESVDIHTVLTGAPKRIETRTEATREAAHEARETAREARSERFRKRRRGSLHHRRNNTPGADRLVSSRSDTVPAPRVTDEWRDPHPSSSSGSTSVFVRPGETTGRPETKGQWRIQNFNKGWASKHFVYSGQ